MRRFWTDEEVRVLRERYPHTRTEELAELFDCDVNRVWRKANNLGLKKTTEYMSKVHGKRLRRVGKESRFEPGHEPWNAGLEGWDAGGRSHETRFQAGNRPHTWQSIGSERLTKDGYLERKMTDTGYTPDDWVGVHVLLWEEHEGPVPDGHAVCFVNGDKEDIRIENLELVSRAELMRRNSIHRYPPALKRTMHAAGKLRRTIEELESA